MTLKISPLLIVGLFSLPLLSVSCGKDDDGNGGVVAAAGAGGNIIAPGQTGSTCKLATECFADVAKGALQGDALCLDRVRGGYCTHTCTQDSQCCAAPGECKTAHAEVCSPFESADTMMCLLSCEKADVELAPGMIDDQAYCQRFAGSDFSCRSSGGGNQNRKVCVPGDCGAGAGCAADGDCASGLSCITTFKGGYCGRQGCKVNVDCGKDSACIVAGDGKNYCFKTCQAPSDCSFCRRDGFYATCANNAVFAETGTVGSVCVPPI